MGRRVLSGKRSQHTRTGNWVAGHPNRRTIVRRGVPHAELSNLAPLSVLNGCRPARVENPSNRRSTALSGFAIDQASFLLPLKLPRRQRFLQRNLKRKRPSSRGSADGKEWPEGRCADASSRPPFQPILFWGLSPLSPASLGRSVKEKCSVGSASFWTVSAFARCTRLVSP